MDGFQARSWQPCRYHSAAASAKRRRACGQIHEEDQIEGERSRKNGVAAKEVDLELHRITKPAKDVDVVPTFLVVAAGGIIVDSNLVIEILIELRMKLRLEDVLKHAEL